MGVNDPPLVRVNYKTNFRKIKEMNEMNVISQPLDIGMEVFGIIVFVDSFMSSQHHWGGATGVGSYFVLLPWT